MRPVCPLGGVPLDRLICLPLLPLSRNGDSLRLSALSLSLARIPIPLQYPSDSLTVITEGSIADMPPDCLVGHFHTRELPIDFNGVTADDAHVSFRICR